MLVEKGMGIDYRDVHEGCWVGERINEAKAILDFATVYDLMVANTRLTKRDEFLIAYKNALSITRIDYFIV